MKRLIAESLVKRYQRVAALEGASLDVRPGELVAVLGPAGSGKSTLSRVVTGLERPDSGEVFLDDRLLNDAPAPERGIGLMTQGEALWPHLTVAENVGFGRAVRGESRRDRRRRVDEAMATVGIEAIADRRPGELDALQRRRAELARAIVAEPEVLVLDEPAGTLDHRDRPALLDDLRRVQVESGRTVLALTRERDDALALADRIAVLDLGRVVQVGTPVEVYESPADAFVAQLLGATNLLQGQVSGTDPRGGVVVRTTIGRMIGRMAGGDGAPPIGTPVTIAIRPEAIRLGPNLPSDANRFTATVERQVFRGALRTIRYRGPGDWPLSAVALQPQIGTVREGQSMTLAVAPDHVIVLVGRYATGQPAPVAGPRPAEATDEAAPVS